MIGQTFANFSIIEKINRGGMSDIYLVADATDRRYALRVMLPEFRYNWRRIVQFNWGCKVLSQLDHPNVIHYYGRGRWKGFHYAVLEFADGPNLRDKILRDDPLLETNRLRILTGMAASLAHLHGRGFIHLDFKPENIVIPKTYDPKLIDFDLAAKRPARPRKLKSLSGTLSYWAPEQIMRQPVDERADVFAFGMTAYEMITGKKPITGSTREEILEKYNDYKTYFVPIRSRAPSVSMNLERVILKCLEKDPARRYPSMSLVVRDLQT